MEYVKHNLLFEISHGTHFSRNGGKSEANTLKRTIGPVKLNKTQ